MKIFIKIDTTSIQGADLQRIESATCLRRIEHDVFIFEFSPVAFTHAHRLLSLNPANYLECFSVYLPNTIAHFDLTDPNQEISLRYGASDQKRKLSEDLGVGIATLFVNQVLGVDWRTIIQIPQNRNLAATRPDFQGIDANGRSYFLEAKGTTSTATLERQISKGKDQVKQYPGNAQRKFVIATYFSGETGYFPSTGFVLDPPSDGNGIENVDQALLLHQRHVLQFMGLSKQANTYAGILVSDATISGAVGTAARKRHLRLRERFAEEMGNELSNFKRQEYGGRTYHCTEAEIKTDNSVVLVRRGILTELYQGLIGYNINRGLLARAESESNDTTSVFDDGTLFTLQTSWNGDMDLLMSKIEDNSGRKSNH